MTQQIPLERFTEPLYSLVRETFEQVQGHYLDRGTSLFETLATISAEEASRPVSVRCASIAAQVNHVRFYIDVLAQYMRGETVGKVNWDESWQLQTVTSTEWEALKQELRTSYEQVLVLMKSFVAWDGEEELGGALAIVIHTAYHLGEIRQALCTIQSA
ncbi:MAG: DinB family protein [Chloroflexi bacterium]|nr:DinB family protein [Chloroflexota bacterium]